MAILGLVALGFSLYAGYAKLAWWLAAGVGFMIAVVVSLMRIADTPQRDRLANGDPDATSAALSAALISGIGGAAFHTVIYFVVRLLVG